MILIVLAVVCVLTVPLAGGSLARFGDLRLRWLWTAPLALTVQVVIISILPQGVPTLHALVHIGTYVLIGIFLWANRRVVGAPIIGLGALMNTSAILANGGVMPASRLARRIAGLTVGSGFHNAGVFLHPHLLWLGDIIPIPGPLPNTLSVGDCFIFLGMLVLLHRTCRVREAPPAVSLDAFERVEIAPGVALFRVTAHRNGDAPAADRPVLVISDGRRFHRVAPLPAPPDPAGVLRAGYRVPISRQPVDETFALELAVDEARLPLPAPTLRPLIGRYRARLGAA